MNCLITVKGDGIGRYGKPKQTRIGPLKDFLVDNQVFYLAITKHLTSCSICSIDDVLKEYLQRRITIPKFKERTASGLVKRAVILERLAAKKNESLTPGLVNEIIWRGGITAVLEHGGRLSLREKYMAFRLPGNVVRKEMTLRDHHLLVIAAQSEDLSGSSDEEFEKLLNVAEIMLT